MENDAELKDYQTMDGYDIIVSKIPFKLNEKQNLRFSTLVPSFSKVSKGEQLCKLYIVEIDENYAPGSIWSNKRIEIDRYVISTSDGYIGAFYSDEQFHNSIAQEDEAKICSIYDDIQSLIDNEPTFSSRISIKEDEITSNYIVESTTFKMWINGTVLLFNPMYIGNNIIMRCQYEKRDLPINKNDSFTFIFEDGTIISSTLTTSPTKVINWNSWRKCDIFLRKNDLDVFSEKTLKSVRLKTQNVDIVDATLISDNIVVLKNHLDFEREIKELFIKHLFSDFRRVINSYNLPINDNGTSSPVDDKKPDTCFVYIMKDEKNGCHKIGISNHPEYREKTLQSDKPFIVMLQAKEFPSRKMARAFEAALHATYSNKNIRGEWFDLSPEEVEEIITSLK